MKSKGDTKDLLLEIDPHFICECASILLSRYRKTDINIFAVIELMQRSLAEIDLLQSSTSLDPHQKFERIQERVQAFYANFAITIKFIYPIMEALHSLVENNVKIKKYET